MTIKEIISALRRGMFSDTLLRLAADTIEKLESENNRQKAEIERLRNDLAKEFVCFVGSPHKVESCPFFDELENERAAAVKEFAERLNDYVFEAEANDDPQLKVRLLFADDIEKAKKEMVGED